MGSFALLLTALLLSTLGFSPHTGDYPTWDGPDCVDCWDDFPQEICQYGTGEDECHMTENVGDPRWDTWDGYCDSGGGCTGSPAGMSCSDAHDHVGTNCTYHEDQEEDLTTAIDGLKAAATFDEASRALRAFQDIEGVWVEFHAERNALQILGTGVCNPVPGGRVIKHMLIEGDVADIWREVLLLR
jgi:hypothetical protein